MKQKLAKFLDIFIIIFVTIFTGVVAEYLLYINGIHLTSGAITPIVGLILYLLYSKNNKKPVSERKKTIGERILKL